MPALYARSEAQTREIGAALAKTLSPGDVVALYGGLGMGKTAFVRGLAAGLGLDEEQVSSPTFALVNEYRGAVTLCHFDMYRIDGEDDLCATGFFDYLDGRNILAIEWSEKILDALPGGAVTVRFSPGEDEDSRVIAIESAEGKGNP